MSEDWNDRWEKGRTGWHEVEGSAALKNYWPLTGSSSSPRGRVLVPLCGKSADLLWLTQQGHEVVGVELAELPIRQFFADNNISYNVQPGADLDRYTAASLPLTLYCGDYMLFDDQPFDALFDRGALVALPPALRLAYVTHTKQLLRPEALKMIITLEYDQAIVQGPPFAVHADEIAAGWGALERIAAADDIENCPPKFRAAGLTDVQEVVWLSA